MSRPETQHKRATYPAYKPSGMNWVGDVPEHWEFRRLKYSATINDEALPETTDPDYEFVYVDIGSVDAAKGIVATETYRFEDAPLRARRIVRHGDTIVSTVRTYLRAIAPIRDSDDNVIVSTGFAVVRPRKLDSGYLSYALRSPFFVETVVSRSNGVSYPAINAPEVGNIGVTIPSIEEQCTIAAFLDRETARIDALIEKKRRQIELLQEKRSALISHAVTKGLDPNAPMKDSGIEWLGQIPEHWKMVRFKYVLWLQRGHDLPVTEFLEGKYPVCGSNGCIGYHNQFTTKGPGVTVGRSGSVGEVNYVDTNYWAHNTALYVKEFRQAIPRYAFYLLKTLDVRYLSEGTAVGTLNRNYIHDVPIAIPLITEQRAIVAFLDRETARIDALVAMVQTSIEKLQEYRTALISHAVTGKIDIRKEVS